MTFSASAVDHLVDRRRLRRQVTRWRVIAFIVLALAVLALGYRYTGVGGGTNSPHIARLAIRGLITGDEETLKSIRDIADSKAAAVEIRIDSPGGTTAGSERVYDELRRLAAKKPVVAVVGTLAASGAYIAALGADKSSPKARPSSARSASSSNSQIFPNCSTRSACILRRSNRLR